MEAKLAADLKTNIAKVIVGKDEVVELLLTAILANGHVLLEDVPGTGKTLMAKSLARSLDAGFARIQFTPDLLPSDVTGMSIYNAKTGAFEFKPGPVFTNILLADEINRATPRTQSKSFGVHGRAASHLRRRYPAIGKALFGHCHAKSRGNARHFPAARGAARPFFDAHPAGIS